MKYILIAALVFSVGGFILRFMREAKDSEALTESKFTAGKKLLLFGSIPLIGFTVFIGLPMLIADLVNSHTDTGILVIVALICGIFGYGASAVWTFVQKEKE